MADSDYTHESLDAVPERRRDRKFSVSANRGRASHKIRYVEAGGAAVDTEDCTFCQSVPEPSRDDEKEKPGNS